MASSDHGQANKAQQIKEARMLASRLQLAINTGRSTTIKMKEVDKLISHRLTMQMASNLQKINEIIDQTKNEIVREQLNKIYLIFLDLFNEFKNIATVATNSLFYYMICNRWWYFTLIYFFTFRCTCI